MRARRMVVIGFAAAGLLAEGCTGNSTAPQLSATRLESVSPAGGSIGVAVGARVVVEFSHPVMLGMERYAAVHEGEVSGPVVAGAWILSVDRTELVFTPAQPLKPATRYTIHLGGGMMGADGLPVDLGANHQYCGGQWATAGMVEAAPAGE